MIKKNHPELQKVLEAWLLFQEPQGTQAPPHWERTEKGHGRIEHRRLWLYPCEQDMQAYLWERFRWPGAQWCGWLYRRRILLASQKEKITTHVWLAGAAFTWPLAPAQAAELLRGHWGIENRVFYVRDVTMDEDRLHGRKIGYGLSSIRNAALNLLRSLGFPYIPDARRHLAARTDLGLPLLLNY